MLSVNEVSARVGSSSTTANAKINTAELVLGIVKRRPMKSIVESDLPRYIRLCEEQIEKTKGAEARQFEMLLAKLDAEQFRRSNNGRTRFEPSSDDRYTKKVLHEKAYKALIVVGKICERFEELAVGGDENAKFLLSYTVSEAISALDKGEAYGTKTRSAFLPAVIRHLLVQVAKNLKDPVPFVQAFTNDPEMIAKLDAAWNAPKVETPVEKEIKITADAKFATVVLPSERVAGKRANFHVCYEIEGVKQRTATYTNEVQEAIDEVKHTANVLEKSIRVFAVVICDPTTVL
jgi:hypothetical protein